MLDNRILQLLPHRPPMLLLNTLMSVSERSAESEIVIDRDSSFFVPSKGVPSWVGVEYMGQTAALIAGLQLEKGTVSPHVGFLLGCRKYKSYCSYFSEGAALRVLCEESAIVGESLATFSCEILDAESDRVLAGTRLSVFRKFFEESD